MGQSQFAGADIIVTKEQSTDETQASVVEQQLCTAAAEGCCRLTINMAHLETISSRAISRLLVLRRTVQHSGAELALTNVGPLLYEILKATRLDEVFPIAETVAAAPCGSPVPAHVRVGAAQPEPISADVADAVFLCDPDTACAEALRDVLSDRFHVTCIAGFAALGTVCQSHRPDVVLVRLDIPHNVGSALDVWELPAWPFLRNFGDRLPVVCYARTENLPRAVYYGALAAGARSILNEEKPHFIDELRACLTRICDRQSLVENAPEVRRIFAEFNLMGQSSGLLHVFQAALTASQVADLPVLILGETGTGKQRLAEAVHKLDPQRREKPFVTVNCTALNETLAASDLFGHRKGAYTGAEFDRLGAFRAAQGGTLLLDELAELHPAVQPKLLHVLQERRLVPVGEDYEHPVDVRVIAATNRPLEDMVAAGQFRADLYERLNGWVIRIPPLRERLEDLEPQAQFFLERCRGERSSHVQGVSAGVLDALRLLPWGGNTRQLENLIRNALARRPLGSLIELADLPPAVVETLAKISSGKPGQERRTYEAVVAPDPNSAGGRADNLVARACEQGLSLADAVEQFERQLIDSVLCRHHGNRTKTAAALGITERGLFNKIKKYKLA